VVLVAVNMRYVVPGSQRNAALVQGHLAVACGPCDFDRRPVVSGGLVVTWTAASGWIPSSLHESSLRKPRRRTVVDRDHLWCRSLVPSSLATRICGASCTIFGYALGKRGTHPPPASRRRWGVESDSG